MVQLIALDTLMLWAIPSNVLGQEGYALNVRSHTTVEAGERGRIWFDGGSRREDQGGTANRRLPRCWKFVGGLGGVVWCGSKCPGLVDD